MSTIRIAEAADVERMMPLVREFYIYERLVLDEARYRKLALELIANEELGRLLVIESEAEMIGYAVIGFGFSLEFGGRDALLDELYVRESHRGHGIGTQAIAEVEELCRAQEIGVVHLEADYVNARVHEFYKWLGFRDHERHLMTKWICKLSRDQER
jgi:GNAT superfamily N-acetyltransferase